MAVTETELADAIIRHAFELQQLSAGEEARADLILRELELDLRSLLASRNISASGKREIEALIKESQRAIAGRYINIAGVVDVDAIVQHVAERTVAAIETAVPSLTFGPPSVETLRSLAKSILIDGAPSAAWWAKQSDDMAFRFAGIVRRGRLNNETNEQIVRKVVGDDALSGIARRNARALVHSSVMTAANQARLAVYGKAFRNGFRWLATLDSNTCLTCSVLDGKEWGQDGKPVRHSQEMRMPPAHMNCRCVASPRPISFNEKYGVVGADEAMARVGGRPSSSGEQKSGTTFDDFLKRQSPAWVNEWMGERRAAKYLAGKITLTDLVTKSGRQRTLAELTQ
jgi:SPP1 gp7 family putative phage head morphogenesis protein